MKLARKLTTPIIMVFFALLFGLAFAIVGTGTISVASAEQTDVSRYYYNQLSGEQKELYKAMEEMDEKGIFKKGADYDLVESGHVTQAQLDAYANGSSHILDVLGAARDAFYADNADIFYVDFSYLSLRVTLDEAGTYHARLGAGRAETYYVQGFNNEEEVSTAITRYETALNNVVTEVKKAEPSEDDIKALGEAKAKTVAQIRAAHTWIAENTVYKLEKDATAGNAGHVRTTYGVFVSKGSSGKGEALCEGYSRAFKTIMDKIGVPCLLVQGVYRHTETQLELHMWAQVEIDGKWYAVDQTFDDLNPAPLPGAVTEAENEERATEEEGDEKYRSKYREYSEEYFLVGKTVMNAQHTPSTTFSDCGHEFTQPELNAYSVYAAESTEHGMIYVVQVPHDEKRDKTDIYVSILIDGKWYGQKEAAKKGYYIVTRYEGKYLPEELLRSGAVSDLTNADESKIEYSGDTWGYIYSLYADGELYATANVKEGDGYTIIGEITRVSGFEVAVTTTPPRTYDPDLAASYDREQAFEMFAYLGDTTMFVARTGLIETKYNGFADYYPAPHILRATPVLSAKLDVGHSYDVVIEYDQWLEYSKQYDEEGNVIGQDTQLKPTVYGMRATGEILKGTNAVPISVISNLTWDPGEKGTTKFGKLSFKFTPSRYFAHDNILYIFNFNLQGVDSHKQVYPVSFAAANVPGRCSAGRPGYNWHVFGQPSLMENSDLSMQNWELSDGTDVSELEGMKDRLALVVTKPTQQQEDEIGALLEKEEDLADGFESFTYNISLALCKCMVLKTGEKVRVSIGFPEGFTYDSTMEGVIFKAYHFIRDAQNHVIGVEELECTVTQYGLIIMCDSFSPFAIVAVQGEAPADTKKTVIVSSTIGGIAHSDGQNLFTLEEGQERSVTIKAHDNYVIESIKANGKAVEVTDAHNMTYTVKYDEMTNAQDIIQVNFVAEKVKQVEEARGESLVVQTLAKANFANVSKNVTVVTGNKLVLNPTVTAYGDVNFYQWYKDGVALAGQTGATLTIDRTDAASAGSYKLVVTSVSGSTIVVAESDETVVTLVPPEEPASLTWLWILLGVLGAAAVAAVVTIVVLKKKKAK